MLDSTVYLDSIVNGNLIIETILNVRYSLKIARKMW